MFFLETLNRGIVKDVGALDYEASIFFCDYGSVANIRVSLHKSKGGGVFNNSVIIIINDQPTDKVSWPVGCNTMKDRVAALALVYRLYGI